MNTQFIKLPSGKSGYYLAGVAEQIGCSVITARNYIKKGFLKAENHVGKLFIEKSVLDDFINNVLPNLKRKMRG